MPLLEEEGVTLCEREHACDARKKERVTHNSTSHRQMILVALPTTVSELPDLPHTPAFRHADFFLYRRVASR